MIRIPLQAVPNQTLNVNLAQQAVQISLRQNGNNIYVDIIADGRTIILTRVCRDRQRLLTNATYRGFIGDFAFVDTQGTNDPFYTGLASRYALYYIGANE